MKYSPFSLLILIEGLMRSSWLTLLDLGIEPFLPSMSKPTCECGTCNALGQCTALGQLIHISVLGKTHHISGPMHRSFKLYHCSKKIIFRPVNSQKPTGVCGTLHKCDTCTAHASRFFDILERNS